MLNEQGLRTLLLEEKHWARQKVDEFIAYYNESSIQDRSEAIYELIGKQIYREQPVGIKTFIEDSYFLGSIYDDVFPMWKNMLQEI